MTTLLYAAACALIFAAGVYRLRHMDAESTLLTVRLVFWAMSVASFAGLLAGAVWGYVADWIDVWTVWSFAGVQVRTATIWRDGVPEQYRKRGEAA